MHIYVKTVKGVNKEKSEDRVLVGQDVLCDNSAQYELSSCKIVVADGVGGNNAGDVAAHIVCEAISCLKDVTKDNLANINSYVLDCSNKNSSYSGMATTCSGCICKDNSVLKTFHVGNTRIYEIKAGMYLKQITEDDTVVQYLISSGQISEEDAQSYPARHEITACFGGGKKDLLKVKIVSYEDFQPAQLVLTSDGIHEYLSIDEMEDIISEHENNWDKILQEFDKAAIENGSMDDRTIIIIDFE